MPTSDVSVKPEGYKGGTAICPLPFHVAQNLRHTEAAVKVVTRYPDLPRAIKVLHMPGTESLLRLTHVSGLTVPTILLVDDDPFLLAALIAILEHGGFCVNYAENGADALKAVHAETPDAIVSDVMMPVMSGVELWRRLALHPVYASIPFLLQSAVDIIPPDVRPTAFLRKPYSPAKLLRFLKDWTGA